MEASLQKSQPLGYDNTQLAGGCDLLRISDNVPVTLIFQNTIYIAIDRYPLPMGYALLIDPIRHIAEE